MVRTFCSLVVLILIITAAAMVEADFAQRHVGTDWVGYCVDQTMGPSASAAEPLQASETLTPATAFARKLLDMDQRIVTAQANEPGYWLQCAQGHRANYINQLLWTRLDVPKRTASFLASLGALDATQIQGFIGVLPDPNAATALDAVQIDRSVERLLNTARKISRIDRNWLAQNPPPADIEARLRGKKLVRKTDETTKKERVVEEADHGVVATLLEMDRKALQAPQASSDMGRATTVIATGIGLLWLLLVVLRLPTAYLLCFAPVWFAGGLLMVSLSLGSPILRSFGLRHLIAVHGWVWWPLVAAMAGVVLTRLLRWDPLLAPWLLDFCDWRGIALRVMVLGSMAVAVAFLFSIDAHRSELWLAIAAFSMALFAARNSLAMSVTQAPTNYGAILVFGIGLTVAGVAVLKNDRGTAILALGLMAGFFLMFTKMRWASMCLVVMMAGVVWWSTQLQPADIQRQQGETITAFASRIVSPCQDLPRRFREALCPQVSEHSDQFRSLAMAKSGWRSQSLLGWGLVELPSNGLAAERPADRELKQLPMDYIAAPWIAAFGKLGLAGLVFYALTLLGLSARSLASLGNPDRSDAQHLLAGLAGFGLLAAALRSIWGFGSSTGAVALSGQPPPMLAFAMSAAVACGFYIGIALASPTTRSSN